MERQKYTVYVKFNYIYGFNIQSMKNRKKKIAYLRVSTDKQDLDTQKLEILEYARKQGIKLRAGMVLTWSVIYGFVGTEMAWVLRPWIGWWEIDYTPFRPLQESFIEALSRVLRLTIGW